MEKNHNKKEEIAVACAMIAENFRLFVSEVIGYENAPFHNELDDTPSNQFNRKLAIALPRGFGKTTHLSIAYPLWEIARNHNLRILLVSSTAEVSKSSLSVIIRNIEQNPKYQAWSRIIDPKQKGVIPKQRARQNRQEHWSGDSIIIDRDDLSLKDPTINAVGLFGSILSKRADIIILDDVVNQENATTPEQREKVKDWIHTTLMPVLVPGGKFICLGNTWHMDDLMSNLLKDPQFDVRKRIPAILHEATRQDLWEQWADVHLDETLTPEEKHARSNSFYAEHKTDMDLGVEVLWPERFPYADLYLKRISNPYSFARMYQCDPSIRPNQKFTEADIERALNKGKDLILQDEARTNYDTRYTTSGLDLAISQRDRSDDTVLLSIDCVKRGSGDIKTGDYVIRNIERGKFAPDETIDRVKRHYQAIRPMGIRVESVGFQEATARDLGNRGIPVTSYRTGGEKNDPDIGVHSLAVLLAQGRLVLPYSNKDARTRQLVTQLVNEMRAYPDGHTGDSLMALWFAYSEARDYTANRFIVPLGSPITPSQHPRSEQDADRAIIQEQELARSGFDPALALKARADEAMRRAHQAMEDEERKIFNGMMRGY